MGAFPKNSGNLKNANQVFLFIMLGVTKGLYMGRYVTYIPLSVISRPSALSFVISTGALLSV